MADAPRQLEIPDGMDASSLLSSYPTDQALPNIGAFDNLKTDGDPERIRRLTIWIEPQAVCDYVRQWHGDAGLARVLRGIAEACAAKRVHMTPRVRAVAGWLGLAIV